MAKGRFLAALALVSACQNAPSRLPVGDGGRGDASVSVRDASVPNVRPDGGPTLPPADREVVLPIGAPTSVLAYTVTAAPAMLDVHLSVDTTGSFVEEIDAIQSTLAGTVIPAIRALVPSTSFGVSSFQDFPVSPFGSDTDRPFLLLQRVTGDIPVITTAVGRLPQRVGNGGDGPEGGYEALYQAATGTGVVIGGQIYVPRFSGGAANGGGTNGGVGFRDDAFRVVVHATDAPSHLPDDYLPALPGVHDADDVVSAFTDEHIRLVAITNGGMARAQMEALALATGGYVDPVGGECPTGVLGSARPPVQGLCPLVFDVYPDGTGLSTALVGAISSVVSQVQYASVRGTVADDRLGFVEAVSAASFTPPPFASPPGTSDSTPGDGYADTFTSVASGTQLVFEVRLRNTLIASQTYAQTFRFHLRIEADSALVVDEWIRVVVPAAP